MDRMTIRVGDSRVKTVLHGKSCDYAATVSYDEYEPDSMIDAIKKSISLVREDEKVDWPKYGELYYTLDFSKPELVTMEDWCACPFDCNLKSRGLVFKRKDEAVFTAKKMLEAVQKL